MDTLKLVGLTFLTALFVSGPIYAQEMNDNQLAIVTGKITYSDPESGTISVQTDEGSSLVFHVTLESNLLNFTRHMSIIEIAKGDPVTVQYSRHAGQNIVAKLVDTKPLT